MISTALEKEESLSAARTQVVQEFIEKSLTSFAGRSHFNPIVEKVEGRDRIIVWRWFINHFFFIERGRIGESPEYMSLVSNRDGTEKELVFANINLPEKWRVLSADTRTWGENLLADVERSEEAVIRSMVGFLFDRGYIVADVENGDEK